MLKTIKKSAVIFLLVFMLFTITSCDPLTNFIDNILRNNGGIINENKDYALVTFSYSLQEETSFSLLIKKGEKIYEPLTPVIDGYEFLGWQEEGIQEYFNFHKAITKDTKIIAAFKEETITAIDELVKVTYNYNIPLVNTTTIKLNKGSKTIEPLTPTREGYKFIGWEDHLNNLFDFNSIVNENITLKARWEEQEIITVINDITVTFDFDNSTNPLSVMIKEGNRVLEPKAPVKEGYTFTGWFKSLTDTTAFNFQSHLTSDITLTARWQLGEIPKEDESFEEALVQFNYNVPNVADDILIIKKGTKLLEPKIIVNDEFEFLGWFVDSLDEEPYDFNLPVLGDLGLIAKWKKIVYSPVYVNVTFMYFNEFNEVIMDTVVVEKDFPMTEPSTPIKEYYNFSGWYLENSLTPFDFSDVILDNYIFIGKWELKKNNVRVSFMKNQEELISSVMVPLGSKVLPISLEEDPNNEFIGWEDSSGNFFNFEKEIFEETILYAVYYPSFENINNISKHVVKGNVKIYKSLYTNSSKTNSISNSMGSGVIIKKEGNVYYVLTNSHVTTRVYKTEDDSYTEAPYVKYEIEDYLGKKYEATLVLDAEDSNNSDVNHDLAILKFTLIPSEDSSNLKVIPISSLKDQDNPVEQRQTLVIVGNPAGQKNAITFGKYIERKTVSVNSKIYDSYDVSIPGAKGSSGSMVINQNHEIIGIVFAGPANIGFTDSVHMYIVPLIYVQDFIVELEDLLTEKTEFIFNNNYLDNFAFA